MFKDKDSISTTRSARVFEFSQQHVAKTLKDKCRIRCYKKKRISKRTAQHLGKVRRLCGRLYRKLKGKSCVIDDKAYFTYGHRTINGNDNLWPYASIGKYQIWKVEKFEPNTPNSNFKNGISKSSVGKSQQKFWKKCHII